MVADLSRIDDKGIMGPVILDGTPAAWERAKAQALGAAVGAAAVTAVVVVYAGVAYVGGAVVTTEGAAAVSATATATARVVPRASLALARGGQAANSVYRSLSTSGNVQYVGITNNLARRAVQQFADKGIRIQSLMGGLSRADARALEQVLIEFHGLGKNGGTLLNRINSIASRNPAYASQVQRGYELLKSIGY